MCNKIDFTKKTLIENILPIKQISELAIKEGNSKKPVYTIHKWWARRLGSVVRALLIGTLLPYDASEDEFWNKFYSKNEVNITVMDPFMGGGTCLIESKKIGAKTIGVDIDTLACFITKKELQECNITKIKKYLNDLYNKVGKKIEYYYTVEVDGKKYPIINVFWVYEISCPKCNYIFQSHPHYKLYYNKKKKEKYVFCKKCGKIHKIEYSNRYLKCNNCHEVTEVDKGTYNRGFCICPSCNEKFRLIEQVSGQKSLRMFALEYLKGEQRIFKEISENDVNLYKEAESEYKKIKDNLIIPQADIIKSNSTDKRPITHGYTKYKELFNKRQLLSLAILYREILNIEDEDIKEWFLIAFSDSLASNNLLCNYAYGYRKLTPLFGIHAYTVPVRPVENNVWGTKIGRGTFIKTINKVIEAKKFCRKPYESKYISGKLVKEYTGESIKSKVTYKPKKFYNNSEYDTLILNRSSRNLDQVKDKSVDLILTDPPYYDNLNYSELANFYYQWIKNEIQINPNKSINDALFANKLIDDYHSKFEKGLTSVFKECFRILKDDGLMVFSYHHNKEEAWSALGNAIKDSGFVITNVFPIRSEGSSGYHSSDEAIKWDSIIVARKKDWNYNMLLNEPLEKIINKYRDYILDNKLKMKPCDILSFYRSIAVMKYTDPNNSLELNILFNNVQNCFKK
ncbi:Adenine-specific DNA methylase, contains a Zn-ribbon domain [Caminicella sporogenes DSM 14501]|uniref:Adenine-specific DNA methylase, contains a Zn-ribbon domain n=1 Tax=Caminicella sporogenes DSM 14501 TaxID=1121266 RepID=A0A1M6PI89_9FIRM|nr:DNA methyltransferase [Caminicella sporogenes]RKD21391.1 hypothetical protein BET04_08085 [Caminicella sporogenes]SHK07637.1 Adenine-specific DNA methylase, contains a Zn-ribbon domain [Caminicella sporogenes DSM 14501]